MLTNEQSKHTQGVNHSMYNSIVQNSKSIEFLNHNFADIILQRLS